MNTLRKQLEALRDDYEELRKGGALAIGMDTLIPDLDAILAEQGEQAPGLREALNTAFVWLDYLGAKNQEGRSVSQQIRGDMAALPASPEPSPAPDAGMREKVAHLLFEMDTGNIGGGWGGENEYQQKEWLAKADRILRICGEGQLRGAMKEISKRLHYPDIKTDSGPVEVYAYMVRLMQIADTALQRTPEPPSREMERKAFVVGWRACLDALADKHARGHEGVEAEAARRYGGET